MKIKRLVGVGLGLALMLVMAFDVSAQGRGGGRPAGAGGGGRPAGVGGGQPTGIGVDRGLSTASTRSNGRSDDGLNTANSRSNGRSMTGIERARLARDNANSVSDNELNRYRGLSRKLGTTPEEMRAAYQAALLQNPDLTYGQFVSANVVADNLGGRFPGITSTAILNGMADGSSLGSVLRDLGMTKDQVKVAQRNAEDTIKAAKRRHR
jgi:hypothetical protein